MVSAYSYGLLQTQPGIRNESSKAKRTGCSICSGRDFLLSDQCGADELPRHGWGCTTCWHDWPIQQLRNSCRHGAINDVSISLNDFSHTWIGDIDATLVFDDGSNPAITLALFGEGVLGPSNDAGGTYAFADGGTANFVGAGSLIPSGTYAALGSFSVFDGLSAAGTWTLNMNDRTGGDSGNLGSWTLNIDMEEVAAPVPAPATLALFGLGLVGLGWSRRRKSNG